MRFYKMKIKLFSAFLFSALSFNSTAASIDIFQSSLFINTPDISALSFQDDQLYVDTHNQQTNTFSLAGFSVAFENNLDANNYGEMTWRITNNRGSTLSSSRFMGFLDADLGLNGYRNYGDTVGDVTSQYASWEIDEPGFSFGDVYDNLQTGILDNTNSVPSGSPEDVSLALGFDVANWLNGETVVATFSISQSLLLGQAGLAQFNPDSAEVFYYSGSIERVAIVPLPASGILMFYGLISLGLFRGRNKPNVKSLNKNKLN